MSEITIDTFTPIIESLLRPPLFLVEKKEQAEKVTIEIRSPQPHVNINTCLLQSISDLFHKQATDELREVLTKQLIDLAEHTLHHSDQLLTACFTKDNHENQHRAQAYVEGKEVFHQMIKSDEDVLSFINRINQLIQKLGSD